MNVGNIVLVVFVVLIIFIIYLGIKVVPQSKVFVVERFGKFTRTLESGLSIIVPFIDRVAFRVDILKNSSSFIDLFVYNLLGQKIRTIRTTVTNPGTAAIIWNGKNDKGIKVASGVYYFQFLYNDFSISKIGLLLK